jgi:D-3-phosphoglycerate dehydrogenase
MYNLVFCRAVDPAGLALLEARPDVKAHFLSKDFRGPPVQKLLEAAIGEADGVLIGHERIDDAVLALAPRLRVVSRFGVGYDGVDIPACTRKGVVVGVVNGANDTAVGEHTMMLLLMVARRALEMDASVRAGTWMVQTGRRMHELSGKTLLVVGYGRIGTRVARLATAFGMRVMVNDPAFPTPRIAADGHIPAPDLLAALPRADAVTLHLPLYDQTERMVNADFLSRMKPTAWLINAARGGLVDEDALAAALTDGTIEAAAVDVLAQEPPDPANPLLKLRNMVFSPHNAAAARETYVAMSKRAVANMLECLDGKIDPGFTVNPEVLGRNVR